MSEELPETPAADAPPKRKLKPVVLVAAAVLALAGGGVAGWQVFLAPKEEKPAQKPLPVYVEVPPMVVNLDSAGAARFLKVRVVVAVRDEAGAEALKARMVEVTDRFIALARTLRPEDLAGAQGMFRVKEELILRASQVAAPHPVEDVLVQELVQQ